MISYYLAIILLALTNALMSPLLLFPDVSLPVAISTSLTTASYYLGMMDNVAPYTLGAIITALASLFTIELAIFAYKFVRWVYQKIPGVN